MKKIVVLGGGISGLTAARTAEDIGHECLLLERCPTLGGLTRTVEVGDFCFDYTGHFLHLCRYATPADIPYAGLANETWQRVDRRSYCFVAGKMITAPIQYNLWELPPDILTACSKSYETRTEAPSSESSFRDFIVNGFGQYLADLFLIPQNEKTMAIDLDRLSNAAVKRFFPPPDDTRVRAGMQGQAASRTEYNSNFWYPITGGISCLVSGLASGLKRIRTNQHITKIDLRRRTLHAAGGETFSWDVMFSSVPLNSLCEFTNDMELKSSASELSHSSTVSFNIGLKGSLPAGFEDAHWIYVPDRTIPFYRVGFYSNISKGTCSQGHSAMYVEVGVPKDRLAGIDLVKVLQPSVIESLERLGWIDSSAITCVVVNVLEHAYVHHTKQREGLMNSILTRLGEFGIFPIGRYGLWDYTSMEDSMESARRTVGEVLGGT